MTLDAVDQAFVNRWQSRRQTTTPTARATNDDQLRLAAAPPTPVVTPDSTPIDDDGTLVGRLLEVGGPQWHALAGEVEAARLAGHRVIAVAGSERREGRTTLVACLARVLRGRQRDVVVLESTAGLATDHGQPADGGRLHDKRIVLVDAGVWFPPGPIRRNRLLIASLGCDAVILVRRADRVPVPAWAAALAAVGVTPLGEVLTFAATPGPTDGGAA